MRSLFVTAMLLSGLAAAQYTREWQSGNLGYNCWGASYGYDVDGDGVPNMWVRSSGQMTIYKNYTVFWNISFPGYDYLYLITPRDIDGDGLVRPVNMDADAAGELVVTAYRLSGSEYYGKIRVYDAANQQLEWESGELAGFVGSGTVDDVDGDGRHEIVITRQSYSANLGYVEVYGYTGQGLHGEAEYGARRLSVMAIPTVSVGQTGLFFQAGGATRLAIYDQSGRLVRQMLNATLPVGEYRLWWDGCDDAGQRVAAGTYFYRLQTKGQVESGSLVLSGP